MTRSLTSMTRLWPGATLTRRPGGGPALLVLPSARNPRILVPAGVRGAHVMLNRHSAGRLHRLGQAVASMAVRSGVLRLLPVARLTGWSEPSVETHIRTHVAGSVRTGVLLGPPRANAKPVLQVFGADGSTVAFAKVGDSPVAQRLVRHEAAVLADPGIQGLTSVDVPRVIAFEAWQGIDVLVLTAMSSSQRRASTWQPPVEAMHEVAESASVSWATVGDSPYWADLLARASDVASSRGARLRDLVQATAERRGQVSLGFGRWHGDWAPWNMGYADARLELWDWEQSSVGVPLGFDGIHFVLQRLFRDQVGSAEALKGLLAETSGPLARWYSEPEQIDATVALYALEILHRYVAQVEGLETPQLTERLAVLFDLADRLSPHETRQSR